MTNELYHWGIKKGEAADKHKYVKREWKNNRWVYFYDTPGNKSKPATQTTKTTTKSTAKAVNNAVSKTSQSVNKGLSKVNSILSTPRKESGAKTAEAIKQRMSEAKQLVESKINSKNVSISSAVAVKDTGNTIKKNQSVKPVDNMSNVENDNDIIIDKSNARQTANNRKKASEQRNEEFKKRQAERQAKREAEKKAAEDKAKKEYEDSQNAERNGIRKIELDGALDMLGKTNTLFKKYNNLPDLSLKNKPTTLDEDMALVNPNYKTNKEKYDQNCGACSIAYELRRRGYDVEVVDEDDWHEYGGRVGDLADCFNGAEIVKMDSIKEKYGCTGNVSSVAKYVDKDILSHGEGARGNISFVWTQGGGHAIAWEVSNGKVEYRDCQTNQKINLYDYAALASDVMYMRTDNLQPTKKCYKFVRDRKG